MPRRLTTLALVAIVSTASAHMQTPASTPMHTDGARCSSLLSSLRLPDVRVTEAREVAADPAAKGAVHVAHCRINGTIGSEIGFGLWLPDAWNGRFLMSGGGGFVGSLPSPGPDVDRGFAVTTTDTGHKSEGIDARWALDNLERQLDFAYLATHRTAVTAKAIVATYYGSDPRYSYFSGCSTGGRQALMEAQRFPDDFDGIVSGAPVFDWTRAVTAGLALAQALYPDPAVLDKPVITEASLKLVHDAALAACDAKDGVADGVIDDPRTCAFDLATVRACPKDAVAPDCLTRAQRAAIARVYSPLGDGEGVIYEGTPVGAEAEEGGWRAWLTGSDPKMLSESGQPNASWGFSTQFYRYFVFANPDWTYKGYDVAGSWRRDTKRITAFMNAENPDLSAFRARHGKLLLWHGWADPALNPLATIRYYESVVARDASARDDVRLFLLPGVLHCAGGPGPDRVERTAAIVDWVEKGEAPSRLIATKRRDAAVVRTRPLCSYPAHAVYNGSGSTDDAANFTCGR